MTPPRASLAAWDALPAPVRDRLALAGTGWRHLARAGADCLRAARETGDAALLRTATDLLLWAWGEAPLHGPLAVEILSATTHPAGLPLPPAARAGLAAVAALWRAPEAGDGGTAYFERLAARRDTARLAEFLAGQIAKDAQAGGAALFWREKALALALFSGEGDISRALQAAALNGLERTPGLAPVAANLRAQAAFLSGDTEACLAALADMGECFGSPFAPARAGLALLAAGDEARALPRLFEALAAAPWQSGLALVAADALSGARREVAPPPGPVAILLYSWNKADDLDATLASLFASELHGARVVALDNGGTDHTAQVLDAWQARAGGALSRIDLPVNIGAAAARNWLAEHLRRTPEFQAVQALVYLDDDVDLPPREQDDWLGRLGAAMRRMPDAGVWGCKVTDHAAPRLLQNVAGMLTIPPEAPQGADWQGIDWQGLSPNPFRLLDAHLQGPDWGLFDYLAPCSSVTGCCHAFARNWLDLPQKDGGAAGGGGFSLMLMPSQYDDFERDLRMLDGGGYAAYTGHLRVRHRKRSGIAGQGADEAGAGAAGNRYKMQCMHDRASVARHIAAQGLRAEAHLRAALALLDQTGEPT